MRNMQLMLKQYPTDQYYYYWTQIGDALRDQRWPDRAAWVPKIRQALRDVYDSMLDDAVAESVRRGRWEVCPADMTLTKAFQSGRFHPFLARFFGAYNAYRRATGQPIAGIFIHLQGEAGKRLLNRRLAGGGNERRNRGLFDKLPEDVIKQIRDL